MDLATDLHQLKGKIGKIGQSGFPCSVKVFMDSLDENNRKIFIDALEDKEITSIALFMYLKEQKFNVAKSTLYKHRDKQCRCFI